ncbi:MAG TPA: O-antigen ligase family protein [Acetobacteraceae bacterium]|nr:O-antigen ligase family protein [Acetobacteraceae bacterium]
MRPALTAPLGDATLVGLAAGGLMAAALACAVFAAPLFWLLMIAASAAAIVFLAFRLTAGFTAAWLLIASASLEMTAVDLLGEAYYQPTIALVKGIGIGLAAVSVLRYGPRLDLFNPAFAWVVMFAGGLAHGLWPGLSAADSLRSLIGSVAPFLFGFSRLSWRWAQVVIRTTVWVALICIAAGAVCDAAGIRPLFVNSGGWRLAGLGHPAFLAGVTETAVYACLIELYRHGRRSDLALLGANMLVLLLTGARAPLTLALAVVGLSLLLVRAPAFPPRHRLLLILAGAAVLPLAAVAVFGLVPTGASMVRAFEVLTTNFDNLSGRQLLWPNFESAAAGSPWLGWGVGAGNVIIPSNGPIARLLQTWAAHNEYLRIEVEGGQIGRALLVLLLVLWVRGHTVRLRPSDRTVMRLVFLALAVHAFTDNVLISTPACVFFAFATAVFARGAWERGSNAGLMHTGPKA